MDKKTYTILIWTSTYWSENNFAVKCIEDTLKQLRKKNIAYKQIIIGETDPTCVKINEFIDTDKSVDIFEIFQKIEITDRHCNAASAVTVVYNYVFVKEELL